MTASSGSRCHAAATSAMRRPWASGRDGEYDTMMSDHSSPRSSVSPPPISSRRIRATTAGSARRFTIASTPPSSTQSGRSVRSEVLDAV
jgi:hypothetical protein